MDIIKITIINNEKTTTRYVLTNQDNCYKHAVNLLHSYIEDYSPEDYIVDTSVPKCFSVTVKDSNKFMSSFMGAVVDRNYRVVKILDTKLNEAIYFIANNDEDEALTVYMIDNIMAKYNEYAKALSLPEVTYIESHDKARKNVAYTYNISTVVDGVSNVLASLVMFIYACIPYLRNIAPTYTVSVYDRNGFRSDLLYNDKYTYNTLVSKCMTHLNCTVTVNNNKAEIYTYTDNDYKSVIDVANMLPTAPYGVSRNKPE